MAALETRKIGTTDIEVTTLGFGGGPLGGVGDHISDASAAKILTTAFERGIRYFDTAPLYGHGLSEKRYGQTLPGLSRDEFVLSSKVGRLLVPVAEGKRDPQMRDHEAVAVRYDYSYDATHRSMEASLERLGLDRIDILLCHDIDIWTHGDDQPSVFTEATNGCLKALTDLRREGVIGAFGLGVNEWKVCSDILDLFEPDCFLLAGRFTLLEQEPLDEFLPKCIATDTSIIIGGPYNSGLLAIADRKRATYDYKPVPDDLWQKAEAIRAVCADHHVDIRAAALQYPLKHPAVAAVIPGMFTLEQLEANLAFIQADIPDALWNDLAEQKLSRRI